MQEKDSKRPIVSKSFGQKRQETGSFSKNSGKSFAQELLDRPKKELAIVVGGIVMLIGALFFWQPEQADLQSLQRYPKAWETTRKTTGVTYYSDTALNQGP